MRIVGGKWRGRQIEAPEGRGVTRPTTDRMRESMASMILSARGLDLSGESVLDAFAGSGAMGLELLSRGAAHATFVDRDRGAVARLRRSAQAQSPFSSQPATKPATMESPAPTEFFTLPLKASSRCTLPPSSSSSAPSPAMLTSTLRAPFCCKRRAHSTISSSVERVRPKISPSSWLLGLMRNGL